MGQLSKALLTTMRREQREGVSCVLIGACAYAREIVRSAVGGESLYRKHFVLGLVIR